MANLDRLKELRTFFAGVPEEKVNMESLGTGFNPEGNNADYSCLSAGCLWGWAMVYEPFVKAGIPVSRNLSQGGANYVSGFANFFDVTYNEALTLTAPNSYPVVRGCQITKAQVLERLDRLIAVYET